MRVELINLPFSNVMHRRLDPPLFLLQLAPKLEPNFRVRINDLNGIDSSQWAFGHCLIYILYIDNRGFSLAESIAKQCLDVNKNAIIIACGSGPSKAITKYVQNDLFNVIIRGEPESAIVNFIQDYFNREDCSDKVYKGEVRNLNSLPLPSRGLIDLNSYFRKLDGRKATMVVTTRGSPYRPHWLCEGLKTFSVPRVMNEVESISQTYGIRHFFFGDEAFCFDKQRALDIGKGMHERGLKFGFNDLVSNVRIELYKELAKVGCKEITLNPFGNKDTTFINSMRAKIEEEAGIKVILRRESKYEPKTKK